MSRKTASEPAFRAVDFALLVLVAGLGMHFALFLLLSASLITHPFGIEDNEGAVVQLAWDLARGRPVYRPLEDFPFVPGDYPPVYLALNAAAIRIFGLSLWPGRLLSFLATLGFSVVLFLWTWRETRWGLWAAAVSLSTFLLPLYFNRSVFYRVDPTAASLSFLGLFLLSGPAGDRRKEIAALACLILALYTKHSMAAGSLACLAYLACRHPRRFWPFFCSWAAAGLLLFLLLLVATRREIFRHLILYHWMAWDDAVFRSHARAFLVWTGPFALASAACTAVGLARPEQRSLPFFFVLASLLHFAALGRKGASLHYLLEPSAAALLATALLLPRLGEFLGQPARGRALSVAALAVLASAQFLLARNHYGFQEILADLEKTERRDLQVLKAIRQRPGEILAQDQTYPLLAGRDSVISPFHMAELAREGRWDQTPLLRAIEEKRFALVILHSSVEKPSEKTRACFTSEVLAAVRRNYQPCPEKIPGRWVYARGP